MSKTELEVKKDFTDIYHQETPVEYLKEMNRLEYRIADLTSPLYQFLAEKIHQNVKRVTSIFDIGSSYGINSMLMTYSISMKDVNRFFLKNNKTITASRAKNFFAQLPRKNPFFEFVLLDISEPALKFAKSSGLCNEFFCDNLEDDEPSSNLKKKLKSIDLFISTGCVGYITEKSFEKIFQNITNQKTNDDYEDMIVPKPMFAFSILRMFPIDKIKKVFEKNDYVLIKCEIPHIRQRKFYDKTEQEKTISILRDREIQTANLEERGYYLADFYVGGPAKNEEVLTKWIEEMEKSNLVPLND